MCSFLHARQHYYPMAPSGFTADIYDEKFSALFVAWVVYKSKKKQRTSYSWKVFPWWSFMREGKWPIYIVGQDPRPKYRSWHLLSTWDRQQVSFLHTAQWWCNQKVHNRPFAWSTALNSLCRFTTSQLVAVMLLPTLNYKPLSKISI